jgi:hypothetical protein
MQKWTIVGLVLVALMGGVIAFALNICGFLAEPTARVDADVLVLEGWAGSAMQVAAAEFRSGHYTCVVVAEADVEEDPDDRPKHPLAQRAAARLEAYGVPREQLIVCKPVTNDWNKTAKTAQAVSLELRERGIRPKGVNLVTGGLHARRSHLAYKHAFGKGIPVGIITEQSGGEGSSPWWTHRSEIWSVGKNFIGWIRELLLG